MSETEGKGGNFLSFCLDAMNKFHPDWEKVFSFTNGAAPTCIPPCLDLNQNRTKGINPVNRLGEPCSIKGQYAEDMVLAHFRRLNIGGFLIASFDTRSFKEAVEKQDPGKYAWNKENFECDIIFLHPSVGIWIFEVKAIMSFTYGDIARAQQLFEKGRKQLSKRKDMFVQIFIAILSDFYHIPILFALCCPLTNEQLSPENYDQLSCEENTYFVNANTLSSPDNFANFLLQDTSKMTKSASDALLQLIPILIGYRNSTEISPVLNALEVHHQLLDQNFGHKIPIEERKERIVNDEMGHRIILSPEQLKIFQCEERCQIFTGPPGSGKTLLILQQILKVANENRCGSVIVHVHSPSLEAKFEQFFGKMKDGYLRKPTITTEINYNIKDCDDYFADEEINDSRLKSLLESRCLMKTTGRTVVVITGHQYPSTDIEIFCNCRIWKLTSIMRSSRNIANTYLHNFPESHVGHNIVGETVYKFLCPTLNEMKNRLQETLAPMLKNIRSLQKMGKVDVQLAEIAIITQNIDLAREVCAFMEELQIPCGSVIDQVADRNLIAVDTFENTLSYEWPFVIAFGYDNASFNKPYGLIACSRATAKLVIIYKELFFKKTKVEKSIEEKEAQIKQLTDQVTAANNEKKNLKCEKTDLHSKFMKLEIQHYSLEKKTKRFDAETEKLAAKLSSLEENVSELCRNRELNSGEKKQKKTKEKLKEQENKIKAYEDKISAFNYKTAQYEQTERDLVSVRTHLKRVTKEKESLEKEVQVLRSNCSSFNTSTSTPNITTKFNTSKLKKKIANLQESNAHLAKENAHLIKENAHLTNKLYFILARFDTLKKICIAFCLAKIIEEHQKKERRKPMSFVYCCGTILLFILYMLWIFVS